MQEKALFRRFEPLTMAYLSESVQVRDCASEWLIAWVADWLSDCSRSRSTEVEPSAQARYSSQLQLKLSIYPFCGTARPLVRQKLWYFPSIDFLAFWHELRGAWTKFPSTAGFSVKNLVAPYRATMSLKSWFLAFLANLKCFNGYETSYSDFLSHF